ncbi:MAG TPA: ABC transporter substrate-binding protein [Chloroflexota bacterium]|nr:ABC transporter substrate-binding protein [Chloroflexota bacterium]
MNGPATALRRVVVFLAVLAATAFTAAPPPGPAAALAAPPAAPPPQLSPVRFGSPQAISDAGVFIGSEHGYFREQGLDVETVPFQSGPNTIPALAAGDLETAGGTISVALLNALERGIQIKMVADKGTSRPGFEFVQVPVRRDLAESGAVRTIGDLRGRHVAVASLQSGAESLVAHVLARGGLSISDVDLVPLGYGDMVVAFGNDAIDSANIIEPSLSAAIDRNLVTTWEPGYSSAAFGGVYQAATIAYSGQFATQADLARRFMVGYLKGVRDYNDAFVKNQGRDEIVRILIENTAVKDPAVYDRMNMAGLDPDGRIARQSLQLDMDYFRQMGYYTGPVTLDDLIDTSFAEYAAQQLGPYQ